MRKSAVFGLVVVVLTAGMTLPVVALQGGPPEHAEGPGDGPPDHANDGGGIGGDGGGDGGSDAASDDGGSSDSSEGDGGGDDRAGGTAADGDEGGGDANAADDAGGESDAADDAGDGPGSTADAGSGDGPRGQGDGGDGSAGDSRERSSSGASSNGGGAETPSNPVTPLLPFFDDSGDDDQQRRPDKEARGQQSSHDSEDPLPVPDDDDDETPTPEPESTPADEGGDDAGGGASSDSNESDGGPSVEVSTNDSATVVNATDVQSGDTVEADLRGPATDGEHVAVESVAVRVGEGGPFTLTATRPTGEAGDAAAPGVPVAYFDVATDAAVENATLTLAVNESALPDGVEPGDVEVLRRTDDGWETTETTYDEEAGVYTVATSGFSTFAVAAPSQGPIEVTDAEVSKNAGGSGENATVVATVENTGDRQATQTFAATVDGETVATRELTLGGGESATVTFDIPADRVRNGTVAVDGVEAGRLQVEETEGGAAAASSDGNLAFGVGAAILVVLSAVGTGLLAVRHEDWEL